MREVCHMAADGLMDRQRAEKRRGKGEANFFYERMIMEDGGDWSSAIVSTGGEGEERANERGGERLH